MTVATAAATSVSCASTYAIDRSCCTTYRSTSKITHAIVNTMISGKAGSTCGMFISQLRGAHLREQMLDRGVHHVEKRLRPKSHDQHRDRERRQKRRLARAD